MSDHESAEEMDLLAKSGVYCPVTLKVSSLLYIYLYSVPYCT